MSSISSFEIIRVAVQETYYFFWISASIAEAEPVISDGTKIFIATGTATFINWSANLLNNEPKNSPD